MTNNKGTQTNQSKVDFLFTSKDLRKVLSRTKTLLKALKQKRNGAILIVLLLYVFIISLLALMDPMLSAALTLKEAWTRTAIKRAEHLALSTASPIKEHLVDEVYKRIQKQLIEHIAKSKGTSPYQCQGTTVQPTSIDPVGGKLENQFGLCEPDKILDGLNGLSDQTIDYLPVIYPNYKVPLTGENEEIRKAIIYQNANKYFFELTNTFVSQQALNNNNSRALRLAYPTVKRQEYYHWIVRAYTEATLTEWSNVTKGAIAYFDITLTNHFHDNNFAGGGDNCDRNSFKNITGECPTEIGQTGTCDLFTYIDPNGVEWSGDASPCRTSGPTSPDECKKKGKCDDVGSAVVCPLAGGGKTIMLKVKGGRSQVGCASLSSRRTPGTTPGRIIDDEGYSFNLAVRLVSYGNTYN